LFKPTQRCVTGTKQASAHQRQPFHHFMATKGPHIPESYLRHHPQQFRTRSSHPPPTLDKATKHRPTAVYNRWFRVFDLGSKARMHLYLFTRIPMAHVFGMARFRPGSHGLRVDRGRWERGQHLSYEDRTCKRCISPSLVDDEYHALFVCTSTACVRQDFSDVVQQCSLGSPESWLKTLMAYPDVKIVVSFVCRCVREAVPPQSRV
jgi:hypothetical protein